MYTFVLFLHSWIRWVILAAGLLAVVRGLSGWNGARPWTPSDARAGAIFTRALDLQMLLGLLLYFALSPITTAALRDFGAAMSNAALRYWAVEHVFGMIIGIALANVGRARIKRTTDERKRHRVAVVFYGLALLAILASIPWPFVPNGRVPFRWSF